MIWIISASSFFVESEPIVLQKLDVVPFTQMCSFIENGIPRNFFSSNNCSIEAEFLAVRISVSALIASASASLYKTSAVHP